MLLLLTKIYTLLQVLVFSFDFCEKISLILLNFFVPLFRFPLSAPDNLFVQPRNHFGSHPLTTRSIVWNQFFWISYPIINLFWLEMSFAVISKHFTKLHLLNEQSYCVLAKTWFSFCNLLLTHIPCQLCSVYSLLFSKL